MLPLLQGTWGLPSAPSTWLRQRRYPEPPRKSNKNHWIWRVGGVQPVQHLRNTHWIWRFSWLPRSTSLIPCLLADVAWRWSLPEPGVALEALRSEVTVEELHDELRQHGALQNSSRMAGAPAEPHHFFDMSSVAEATLVKNWGNPGSPSLFPSRLPSVRHVVVFLS